MGVLHVMVRVGGRNPENGVRRCFQMAPSQMTAFGGWCRWCLSSKSGSEHGMTLQVWLPNDPKQCTERAMEFLKPEKKRTRHPICHDIFVKLLYLYLRPHPLSRSKQPKARRSQKSVPTTSCSWLRGPASSLQCSKQAEI